MTMPRHGCTHLRGYETSNQRNGESTSLQQRRFSRLFPDLAPLYTDPKILREAGDDLMRESRDQEAQNKAQTYPLGFVFLGQFIDHDITLDVTSELDESMDPEATRNFRTPALDLGNLYGLNAETWGFLRDENDRMLVSDSPLDVPRAPQGRAIIGDHRNDEVRVVSQLHASFLKFHNAVADHTGENFEEVRRLVRWHYQWVVLHEFLTFTCGEQIVRDVLTQGRKIYRAEGGRAFLPIEFAVAAYRYGHSQIPSTLQLNENNSNLELFGSTTGQGFTPVQDASGTADWRFFFPRSNQSSNSGPPNSAGPPSDHSPKGNPGNQFNNNQGKFQTAQKLDEKIAEELLALPFIMDERNNSLATRNLLRGQTFGLPSGQDVACSLGEEPLGGSDIGLHPELNDATPLWLYILREAAQQGGSNAPNGERLGPVGGRIVAETLIGLLTYDNKSFLAENPNWQPELPRADGSTEPNAPFRMWDLLTFAGVTS